MAGNVAYENTIRIMLDDSSVDVGIVSCIPLAPTLNALPKASRHREDYLSHDSVVQRIISVFKESKKAWVSVIDVGHLYDPMARLFEENRIPVFRTIDRALRLFDVFCESKLRNNK